MMRLALILALISHFSFLNAQSTGSIQGQVFNNEGQPAYLVSVVLKGSNAGTTTDESGYFTINNLQPGKYSVTFSFIGLKSLTQHVHVEADKTSSLTINLELDNTELQEVTIHGVKGLNEQSVRIGKAPIQAFDMPQSLITINQKVLEEQQTLRVSDVLKNVSGVYLMGTTGGTQEEIAGRGFAFGSNNTFKNGVRFNNAVMPEISSLESVEVLKGSNAILFGNVAAGGVLNLVTKKPKFENGGQLSVRMGSYNFYKPSIDVYGAVNNSNNVAYRLNASYENAESFRDVVKSERMYINPSLLFKITNKTTLLVETDYLHDTRTPDYGIGAINYTITELPRNRFLGAAWANYEVTQKSLTLTATHDFNPNWSLRFTGGAQGFESDLYSTARPTTIKPEDGSWIRNLQRTGSRETYLLTQLDLTGNFQTGKVKHSILIGGDVDQYRTNTLAYGIYANQLNPNQENATYDTINVFHLSQFEQRTDIPRSERKTLGVAPKKRAGLYVQDFITITENIKILAGLRYTYMETGSKGYKYDGNGKAVRDLDPLKTTQQYDDAFTPRFGIVYQPLKTISLFASYANSFVLNSGVDIHDNPLKPSMMDQHEIGVKNDFWNGLVSANITAYQIVNSNQAQSAQSPDKPLAKELAGEVTSKGVELDVMTKSIQGFSFIAGYSYNNTKYTKSKDYIVGSRLRYNPAHTTNFATQYNFAASSVLNGLNAGFTLFYVSDMAAGRSTRLTVPNDTYKLIPLPSYLQVDLSLGYTYNNISLRTRITNVTNVLTYYAHDDNSINPIAPRQFVATLTYKL